MNVSMTRRATAAAGFLAATILTLATFGLAHHGAQPASAPHAAAAALTVHSTAMSQPPGW
jgi:hypothetical protein